MHFHTDEKLPPAIRLAHLINRVLTWGMARDERHRFLTESLADWEAMARDVKARHVLSRAIRGVPAAMWARMDDRDVTSMPAGVALTLVGIGGFAAAIQSTAYPAPFRQSTMVAAVGFLLLGINFVRDPRRIVLRRYRPVALVIAVGFAGLALTLPQAADWQYDSPVLENFLTDTAIQASFIVIAIAFLILLAGSFLPNRHRLVSTAGVALIVGVTLHGMAQITWGIWMAPIDLAATAASVMIGLGALSLAHVLPRLRHLEIVYAEDHAV